MSTIILTSDLTITDDVTLVGADGSPVAGYEVPYGASVSITNFATVTIIGNHGGVAGDAYGLYAPFGTGSTSVFWNQPGAVFQVSGNEVDAYGIQTYGGWSAPDVINEGTIIITSTWTAIGFDHYDSDFSFTNTGLLQVSGQASGTGLFLVGGGSFDNAGTIEVSGGNLGSVGVVLEWVSGAHTSFTNSGTITAVATGNFPSIGVVVSNGTEPVILNNSGTISGDYAIWENQIFVTPVVSPQIIENSGTLIGAVDLGLGDDVIYNSGSINGVVFLGSGNDLYDGTSGFVAGPVHGDAGADTFISGASAETFVGGANFDTVVYSGNLADYALVGTAETFTIGDGVASIDTLTSVEFLTFADGTFAVADLLPAPPPGVSNDFNGDGTSDILWQSWNGILAQFEMQNGVPAWADIGAANVEAGWHLAITGDSAVTGDFDGDGTTDILFYNNWSTLSGAVGEFEMHDGVPTWTVIGVVAPGWQVAGAGDFNGDGTDDILFFNVAAGGVAQFEMHDSAPTWAGIGAVSGDWQVAGTGDFNGDGTDDILWYNAATGGVAQFEMQDGVPSWVGIGAVSADWQVAGIGDFNGDGTDDILWYDSATGGVGQFVMNDGVPTWAGIGAVSTDWQVAATGDYNGDGTDDILWWSATATPGGLVTVNGVGQFVMNDGLPTWAGVGTPPETQGWQIVA